MTIVISISILELQRINITTIFQNHGHLVARITLTKANGDTNPYKQYPIHIAIVPLTMQMHLHRLIRMMR